MEQRKTEAAGGRRQGQDHDDDDAALIDLVKARYGINRRYLCCQRSCQSISVVIIATGKL